jgi:hypothetical protein
LLLRSSVSRASSEPAAVHDIRSRRR